MLRASKRAHRTGLTINFPLPLKMTAHIRKYTEICRNFLPGDVTCTPHVLSYTRYMQQVHMLTRHIVNDMMSLPGISMSKMCNICVRSRSLVALEISWEVWMLGIQHSIYHNIRDRVMCINWFIWCLHSLVLIVISLVLRPPPFLPSVCVHYNTCMEQKTGFVYIVNANGGGLGTRL